MPPIADSARTASSSAAYTVASSNSYAASSYAARSVSAARAASNRIAYNAATFDANSIGNWNKLWPDAPQPDGLAEAWDELKSYWAADWSFWIEWYEAVLEGRWTDWDLIVRIATTLKDEDWDKGAAHVAAQIEKIRADFDPEPLDQDALKSHMNKLAETPALFADSAESASNLIADAVQRFKDEDPKTNRLPDGYEIFEKLPGQFTQISVILRSPDRSADKAAKLQDEVNRLNAFVQQLQFDLAAARQELSSARLTTLEAQQTRTFGERLQTTLTNVTLVGAIGMTTLGFFGVSAEDLKYDAMKEALRSLAEDMENAKPSPDADTLPPATEV